MQPTVVALVVCLTVLVIGVVMGRATAPRRDVTVRVERPHPPAAEFDPEEFGLVVEEPPEIPQEIDPELQWQMHLEQERAPSAKDQPEDRPHMVGRGIMHQSMVPLRVTSATSEWGNGAGMLN